MVGCRFHFRSELKIFVGSFKPTQRMLGEVKRKRNDDCCRKPNSKLNS